MDNGAAKSTSIRAATTEPRDRKKVKIAEPPVQPPPSNRQLGSAARKRKDNMNTGGGPAIKRETLSHKLERMGECQFVFVVNAAGNRELRRMIHEADHSISDSGLIQILLIS